MFEIKVSGPHKRTIINSLRYQLKDDVNKFQLLRFKSLPINVTKLKISKLQTLSEKQIDLRDIRKSLPISVTKGNKPTQNKNIYLVKQIEPHYRVKFCISKHDQSKIQQIINNKRSKSSCFQPYSSQQSTRLQKIKTLPSQNQIYQNNLRQKRFQQNQYRKKKSYLQNSIQKYIKKHLSFNSEEKMKQIQIIGKMNIQQKQQLQKNIRRHSLHQQQKLEDKINRIESMKFISSSYEKASKSYQAMLQSNKKAKIIKNLYFGELSPKMCQIKKMQCQSFDRMKLKILKKIRNQQQDYLINQYNMSRNQKYETYNNKLDKIQQQEEFLKLIQKKDDDTQFLAQKVKKQHKTFKNSLGPWKNSGFIFEN